MKDQIRWIPKEVNVKDVKPTPNNFKIKTDLGKERLSQSLKMFGLAGTVIVNTDLCLIDGNSRLIEAKEKGEKKIWVSMPNRKLSVKEFSEMSAMYDYAKAGEVDLDRIKGELGTAKDFYEKWNIQVPKEMLDKLGVNQAVDRGSKVIVEKVKMEEVIAEEEMQVTLFFNTSQEAEFRRIENILKEALKTASTSDTVFKIFKMIGA